MFHEKLTPLLFMCEELQPKPRSLATETRLKSRLTIASLRFYNEAIAKFYPATNGPTHRHSPPAVHSPLTGLPTPPKTIQSGSSRTIKRLSPARPDSDISSPTPPFHLFSERTVNTSAAGTRIPYTSNALDPDSDDENSEIEIIEIESDSDHGLAPLKFPILLVIWTMVCLLSHYGSVEYIEIFCLERFLCN